MDRRAWHEFRGYPALTTHSHVDSLMCVLAILFLEQVILPYPIYHQEHSRAAHADRPTTDFTSAYQSLYDKVPDGKLEIQDVIENDEGWGLGNIDLEETVLRPDRS
jgi:hypothetical protein